MHRVPTDRTDWLIAIGLALLTLAVYGQVIGHDFLIFDDTDYVVANPHVRRGLSSSSIAWALTGIHIATWHPLTSLSHLLDLQLFGLHAGAHLLENAALHALNGALLFAVLRRMTGRRWPSALVAALFALHPLHVESVAWVSERKDVLSTLFWMLTLLAYDGYARRPNARRYALLVLVFALGLLAKPMLVTMPFVLLLLDWWPLRRLRRETGDGGLEPGRARLAEPSRAQLGEPRPSRLSVSRLILEKVPLLALAAVVSVITLAAQRQAGAVTSLDALPLGARLANAVVSYATYLIQTVAPFGLAPFYPMRPDLPAWEVGGAMLLLLALSAVAGWGARTRPYLAVGWAWYLGTLVPVLGLVKQGEQAMADRFTYIPLIGIFIMLAWGLADLAAARRWPARRLAAAATAALIACTAVTFRQVSRWRDSETLFRHALAVTRDNYLAHLNLGAVFLDSGRNTEALAEFEVALRLRPNLVTALVNAGKARAALGQPEAAAAAYQRALQIDPDSALGHYNYGVLLVSQGRLDDAAAHYEAAVAADPDYAKAHNNLGAVRAEQGRFAAAVVHYRSALALYPDLAPAHLNLAVALEATGRPDEALAHARAAVRLAPEEPRAHLNLGAMLMGQGQTDAAIEHYREAVRLRPDLSDAQIALADALARRGAAPSQP
jgi:tetratricopeptide (TPR) repeat protein